MKDEINRKCVICQKYYYINKNTCVETQPPRTYISDDQNYHIVSDCYDTCETCKEGGNENIQNCESCPEGTYLW